MPDVVSGDREIWVAVGGDDAAAGTRSSPLASIQAAVDRSEPGTTILLETGRWEGQGRSGRGWVTIGPEDSGRPDAWVRLTAAPGASPRLVVRQGEALRVEGSYVEVSGLTIEGVDGGSGQPERLEGPHYGYGILVTNEAGNDQATPVHHVVIIENTVSGFSVGGIAVNQANWVVVGSNAVSGNSNWGPWGGSGISLLEVSNAGGSPGRGAANWITNNLVHDNRQLVPSTKIGYDWITDGNCIITDRIDYGSGAGQVTLISQNTVHSCGGRGVNVFQSSNVIVEENLSWHNGATAGLPGEMYADGQGVVFRANTVVPRPGRSDLLGDGRLVDNVVLTSDVALVDAVERHRSRTGARVPFPLPDRNAE